MPLVVRIDSDGRDPAATERILRLLPDWFGIEEALQEYVAAANRLTNYRAVVDDTTVGVQLVDQHFPASAEIHLIAVDPQVHRHGIGRLLVSSAEHDLRATGTRFLQVKTLGASRPDEHYARTREFYGSCGFSPLEEIVGLWAEHPCLIMVKTL